MVANRWGEKWVRALIPHWHFITYSHYFLFTLILKPSLRITMSDACCSSYASRFLTEVIVLASLPFLFFSYFYLWILRQHARNICTLQEKEQRELEHDLANYRACKKKKTHVDVINSCLFITRFLLHKKCNSAAAIQSPLVVSTCQL